ncbi:hypothetical protein [Peribacillus sp. N1]
MNIEEQWLTLDEHIEMITMYLSIKQKLPFERLASKLIMTLIPTYKITSSNYPAIDGYWKPNNPSEILKLDSRLSAENGWVLFSMKTSSNKKTGINLLQDSIRNAKKYAEENLKTKDFTWIGVTNVSLSPKEEDELINFGYSQGVKNIGIFKTYELDNSFIRTHDEAKEIAYNLGMPIPQYKYKLNDFCPAVAAGTILRELNYLWNNIYNEFHLRFHLLRINDYFARRMKKVEILYTSEDWEDKVKKIEKNFRRSMSLDIGDDVYNFYLAGENLLSEVTNKKIHTESEIGNLSGLTGENRRLGKYIEIRELSVVYCFYRYILRFFQDGMTREFKVLESRAKFSNIFDDFIESGLKKEHKKLFRRPRPRSEAKIYFFLGRDMHPKSLKYRIER